MRRILIIDDDPVVGNVYRNKLQLEGFEVEWSKDGEQAVAALDKSLFNLVVIDLLIPKVTCTTVIQRIRTDSRIQHIPIFVLTNGFASHLVQEAWKAGATKCIATVSTSPWEIIKMVSETLAGSSGAPQPAPTPVPSSAGSESNEASVQQVLQSMRSILAQPAKAIAQPRPAPTARSFDETLS